MKPVPLHNHSEESVFDGMSSMEEIVARTIEMGSDAVALTDHGVVSGHLAFDKACRKAGIKPIFGMEGYQARNRKQKLKAKKGEPKIKDAFHLILLAQNDEGLKNLWTLSSLAHATGFYSHPRMDWDLLREYNKGIIATSACLGGWVSKEVQEDSTMALEQYLSIFGDRFYIELHTYDSEFQAQVNLALVDLARKFGLPVVYATDAHYAREDQYDLHEQMLAIAHDKKKKDGTDEDDVFGEAMGLGNRRHPHSLWMKDEDRIRQSLSYLPRSVIDEAIKNSELIAEMCNAELPGYRKRLPDYRVEDAPVEGTFEDAEDLFIYLMKKGYREKVSHLDDDDRYIDRLLHEFEVIRDADLIDFFLITWDYCRYADEQGITRGPGRGSAAGSLLSYVLGITDIDPLRYDLIFERFYNAGREKGALPDIDIDFPTLRRQEVIDYCSRKYGEDCVAGIGTKGRLHGASTLDRAAKIHKVDYGDLQVMKEVVKSTTTSGLMAKWADIEPLLDAKGLVDKYPDFFTTVRGLHGRIYQTGAHASGYIIADESLYGTCPVRWSASKNALFTQFEMNEVAGLGFMKGDFLGLTKIDILDRTREHVKRLYNQDFEFMKAHQQTDEIIAADVKAWELLDKGLTTGVFQIEEGTQARKIAKAMKARSIDELAIEVAMNRPGPDSDEFLARHAGEPWTHMHPILEDILDETYGLFLYQEQIIHYMVKLGFSLMEADDVRRMMGKKKVDDMAAFKPEYLKRARDHMSEADAERIWDAIASFAMYGFNKSHAVAYAVLGYWTATGKGNYTAPNILSSIQIEEKEKASTFINDAALMNIKVRPPDINKSGYESDLVDGEILFGLSNVKGVGRGAEWIVKNRPFKSRKDLEDRLEAANKEWLAQPKEVQEADPESRPKRFTNAGKIEALWNAGAFDGLEERDVTAKQRREYEQDLLGIVLSNPGMSLLEKYNDVIQENCVMYDSLDESGTYCVAGVITKVHETKTRNGKPMMWLTLSCGSATIRLSVFEDTMKRYDFMLVEYNTIIAEIRVNARGKSLQAAMELK